MRRQKKVLMLMVVAVMTFFSINQLQAIEINDKIKLNGYINLEYEKMLDDEGDGDPNGSFDMDLIDIVLNIQLTNRLRVATDLTWEHGAATEDERGNVAVEYAFIEYTFADAFALQAGKMFVPFGIYNEIHTAKPAFLTVKEPLSTNKNNKFGSVLRFYPRWATGISFVGNPILGGMDADYNLQISNGESDEVNPFEEDDNSSKAVTGRFRIYPMENLQVGASVYYDAYENLDSIDGKVLSYGAQLEWSVDNLGLQFEVVKGYNEPSGVSRIDRWAMTAMAAYTFLDKYTPYFRYEYLDPNEDMDNDSASLYIAGININFLNGLVWKAEFDYFDPDENNMDFSGKSYTEFKTSFTVGF